MQKISLLTILLFTEFAIAQENGNPSAESRMFMFFLPLLMVLCGIIIWSIRQEGEIKANRIAIETSQKHFEEFKRSQAEINANIYQKHDDLNSQVASRILDMNKEISKLGGKIDVLIQISESKKRD